MKKVSDFLDLSSGGKTHKVSIQVKLPLASVYPSASMSARQKSNVFIVDVNICRLRGRGVNNRCCLHDKFLYSKVEIEGRRCQSEGKELRCLTIHTLFTHRTPFLNFISMLYYESHSSSIRLQSWLSEYTSPTHFFLSGHWWINPLGQAHGTEDGTCSPTPTASTPLIWNREDWGREMLQRGNVCQKL